MSSPTPRCERCNDIHDKSPAALAMCRAAAAVLDEDHRPGFQREKFRALLAAYREAYDAWAGYDIDRQVHA